MPLDKPSRTSEIPIRQLEKGYCSRGRDCQQLRYLKPDRGQRACGAPKLAAISCGEAGPIAHLPLPVW